MFELSSIPPLIWCFLKISLIRSYAVCFGSQFDKVIFMFDLEKISAKKGEKKK